MSPLRMLIQKRTTCIVGRDGGYRSGETSEEMAPDRTPWNRQVIAAEGLRKAWVRMTDTA